MLAFMFLTWKLRGNEMREPMSIDDLISALFKVKAELEQINADPSDVHLLFNVSMGSRNAVKSVKLTKEFAGNKQYIVTIGNTF
jgi:uncharacterized protein YciU (UPF0263 family)